MGGRSLAAHPSQDSTLVKCPSELSHIGVSPGGQVLGDGQG